MKRVKVIAFDADDTLWVNEPFFRETEALFCDLVKDYAGKEEAAAKLFAIEMKNLKLYGYGVKGFTLSLIETLGLLSEEKADFRMVKETIALGQSILSKPVSLLDGVEEVLGQLNGNYRLVMATKGDLLDQERKLIRSGLEHHFHHIEVLSDKQVNDYRKLLNHLDCQPEEFLMVGNSMKSDILPVLELGAWAVHVPFHTTWEHERVDVDIDNPKFLEAENITEILQILR
jgi:putative hydrolase of the HAD superfamily